MKLLSSNETKHIKDKELVRDISKAKTIKEVRLKEETELNNLSAKFEMALARQKVTWSEEEVKHVGNITKLQEEIHQLEKRREELLFPIEIIEKKARLKLEEAEQILTKNTQQLKENEEIQDLLEDHLTEVADREEQVKLKEFTQQDKEAVLHNREENIKKLSQDLSIKWQEYFTQEDVTKSIYKQKDRELELREINLQAREMSVTEKEKNLFEYERRLHDQRATLERELKRHEQRKT